jgi:4'-phosphopantetheinyl transferase
VLLALYTGRQPRELTLSEGSSGKPELDGLHFNLSHSGSVALYALSAAGPVGVDVEARPHSTQRVGELALAARAFGAAEAERLARLDPPARGEEFLRAWTRHEAALKCSGNASRSKPPAWVADLELELGVAAVALTKAPRELCCYGWGERQERAA